MPWYMKPDRQRKVMNRLANRWFTKHSSTELVRNVMDLAQELLWAKVESFYLKRGIQL